MPGCGATLHFVPGGRALAQSKTQVLSSTQRAGPGLRGRGRRRGSAPRHLRSCDAGAKRKRLAPSREPLSQAIRDLLFRVDLIEHAAVGEVRRLRLGPAAERVVDREQLQLREL